MTTPPPSLPSPAVVVGIGEIGSVFARGLLRTGRTVVPVVRTTPADEVAAAIPDPALVLVTVAEADLDAVLTELPPAWRGAAALVQNELLPRDWRSRGIEDPTVAVVWFEKKPGQDVKVIIPTPVAGPGARLLIESLEAIGIPAMEVVAGRELLFELVAKNLYILTANLAGLVVGGTVGALWEQHRELAESVAAEILDIQQHLTGEPLDRGDLIDAMVRAFEADPEHKTTGRSAPSRLARALRHAREARIATPQLDAIAASLE